jgi:peptidoglycan hydrolase-like protein with peptidoglycan-binding domain
MSYHQIIYNRLRQAGMTEAGALGCLGNWECESNCEPNRVQGDFSSYRTASKQYVADVTAGRISREQFGKDGKGFGIYQLTYFSRKLGYYDFWKESGKALDDVELQVDYAVLELKRDYGSLYQYLCHTDDIVEAARWVCCDLERPAVNNVNVRYAAALRIRKELDLTCTAVVEDNATTEEKPEEPKLETWPPRVIDEHCTGWPEVWLLQALLKCRGYNVLVDGIWGSLLTDKVKQFQQEHQLDADGAVGPKTWAKLLEV